MLVVLNKKSGFFIKCGERTIIFDSKSEVDELITSFSSLFEDEDYETINFDKEEYKGALLISYKELKDRALV